MTATAAPRDPSAAPEAASARPPAAVLGESRYDRVSSLLMAVVVGASVVVGSLALLYLTNRSYAAKVPAPIEIIEVFGGGGGRPEGEERSIEKIDVPEADAADFASNNELQPSDFEEPSVRETPSAMLDALMESTREFADLAEEMPQGGAVATGVRASKRGMGAAALGFGPGDGGVAREERWSILYNPGQTAQEYARQLDFFGVEMATILDGRMHYARAFSRAEPETRIAARGNDDRLFFLWQGEGRKEVDVALLRKAGIEVGRQGAIFQFYPDRVEDILSRLEVRHEGLEPSEIRSTTFTVVPSGRQYVFRVIDQQPLE